MNDWTDQACITLFTERNQPMRTCDAASPLSMRMFGTSNGVSTQPMPSSIMLGCFGSGMKFDMKVGAALRCRHATTFLLASIPASSRSAVTV